MLIGCMCSCLSLCLFRQLSCTWVRAPRSRILVKGTSPSLRADGRHRPRWWVLVGWIAPKEQVNHLYLARPTAQGNQAVRVNPEGLEVESLHQSPGIAVGPEGEIYVSWSSSKAKPEGTLFASDLRLSRSLDGGQHFEPPLRINEDRPISHSFEGLAVAADGTVLVSWIDSRDGWEKAGTYLARITQRGTQVESLTRTGQ